jgi:hypothetical protein
MEHVQSDFICLWGTQVDASNLTLLLYDGSTSNVIFRKVIAGAFVDITCPSVYVAGVRNKIAVKWSSAGAQIFFNGVAGTLNATATPIQLASTMQIGGYGNGAAQPFAEIRNVKTWKKVLTNAQLITLTT